MATHLQHASPLAFAASINEARRAILHDIGAKEPPTRLLEPLGYATYVFAFREEARAPVGLFEAYFHERVSPSFANSPYGNAAQLSALGTPSTLLHVRSMYIQPAFRGVDRLFARLTMGIAALCERLNVKHFTAGTSATAERLLGIYAGRRAETLGPVPTLAGYVPQVLLSFTVSDFQADPLYPAVRERLAFDPQLLEAMRATEPIDCSPAVPRKPSVES